MVKASKYYYFDDLESAETLHVKTEAFCGLNVAWGRGLVSSGPAKNSPCSLSGSLLSSPLPVPARLAAPTRCPRNLPGVKEIHSGEYSQNSKAKPFPLNSVLDEKREG